jgi:hypothetical protein
LTKTGNLRTGAAAFFRFLRTYNISAADAFPLSDHLLAYWAHWLAAEGKSYDSIKGYFYDVVAYQVSWLGGPPVDRATLALFNLVLKEVKQRPRPPGTALLRLPIERHHLAAIRASLDICSARGATIWAACCAAFYGLLRVGEFTTKDGLPFNPAWQAKRGDLVRGWDPVNKRPFYKLHLPRTKTGVPGTAYLGFSGAFDCPFTALSHMVRLNPTRSPDDPVFNLGPGAPLMRDDFVAAVRSPLARAGCAEGIHGHSFRIGGATLLAAAGVGDHIIRLAGRWQSDAFLVYVRQHHRILPQTAAIVAALPFPPVWRTSPS